MDHSHQADPKKILRLCRHKGCFYFERGWRIGSDDQFEGNMLEQGTLCVYLKAKGTGLIDECPNWPDAEIEVAWE